MNPTNQHERKNNTHRKFRTCSELHDCRWWLLWNDTLLLHSSVRFWLFSSFFSLFFSFIVRCLCWSSFHTHYIHNICMWSYALICYAAMVRDRHHKYKRWVFFTIKVYRFSVRVRTKRICVDGNKGFVEHVFVFRRNEIQDGDFTLHTLHAYENTYGNTYRRPRMPAASSYMFVCNIWYMYLWCYRLCSISLLLTITNFLSWQLERTCSQNVCGTFSIKLIRLTTQS